MKQFASLTMLLLAALLPISLLAQWTPRTSGTTNTLQDVFFLNENYGAVVGDSATILLTTNGGTTWQPHTIPTKSSLQSVEIIGIDTILVAAGSYFEGEVYLTTNGGDDWELVAEGIDLARSGDDYFALNAETILRSEDQGETWNPTAIGIGGTTLLERLHFPKGDEGDVGYAIGNIGGFASYSTVAYRSEDGGQSWVSLFSFDFPNANAYTAASFPSADTGYIFTNLQERFLPGKLNQLIKVYNFYYDDVQTQQWRFDSEIVNDSLPTYMYDAHFFDTQNGYAVGENGTIYKTTNGGVDWTVDYAGNQLLTSIFMRNESAGYAVGANGTILEFENSTNPTTDPLPTRVLNFYPNPTNGTIRLEGIETNDAILTIFSPIGQILQQKQLNGEQTVDLNNLANGWYTVQVRSGGQVYNGKMIVNR